MLANSFKRLSIVRLVLVCVVTLTFGVSGISLTAQTVTANPLTQTEFVARLNQLLRQPNLRQQLIEDVRTRGINFELTDGLRSLIATRSRNDTELWRTLSEAVRRRDNPVAHSLPNAAEAEALLNQARAATLEAADKMPDFVVNQSVTRAYARGTSRNFLPADRLNVMVTYREGIGERYKLVSKNDVQFSADEQERASYEQSEGATSTGEFASVLTLLFKPESQTVFRAIDTDTVRNYKTIVYDFEIKRDNSKQTIKAGERVGTFRNDQAAVVGSRGKIWIDRATKRIVRLESAATEIPAGFPITSAVSRINYDWATIDEAGEMRKYLMPMRAELEMTAVTKSGETWQSRNDIRFRNYRKFGSKVTIEDDDGADLPEDDTNN